MGIRKGEGEMLLNLSAGKSTACRHIGNLLRLRHIEECGV